MPPVSPRTAPREKDIIHEVFVSATAKDVKKYRKNVRDALQGNDVAVFLQERWSVPAVGVVKLCLDRLAESDGYLGIFGFRYGWIPQGETRSITEIECDRAFELWRKTRDDVPPIFLFVPEAGKQAAKDLEATAEQELRKEYPTDEAKRTESRQRQKAFRERLGNLGIAVNAFATLRQLREGAITAVAKWNLFILKSAATQPQKARSEIAPSDLGAIDREDQIEALESALVALNQSGSPGMCVVVHGSEDMGQFAFVEFLKSWDQWNVADPSEGLSGRPREITPPHDRFDASSIFGAATAELTSSTAPATPTADSLAAAIAERCRDEPLVMFLKNLDRLNGGLTTFQEKVWKPLMAAVRTRTQAAAPAHPFVLVLTLTMPLPTPAPVGMWSGDVDAKTVDYDQLVPLPELGAFTRGHILRWLDEHGVDLATRKPIADRVTKDGVPRAVFDRLNNEGVPRAFTR